MCVGDEYINEEAGCCVDRRGEGEAMPWCTANSSFQESTTNCCRLTLRRDDLVRLRLRGAACAGLRCHVDEDH